MNEPDLRSLRYFLAVCETGSITKAAAQEHVVVSAISKRIAQLEESLGVVLLERAGRRGVTLTAAADTLIEHSRAMLHRARQIKEDMAAFGAGLRGKVHLLASISAISESLPDDVAAFMSVSQHREIQVDIEEDVSESIVRRIHEGSARMGVLWNGTDLKGLTTAKYRSDHLVVVVHPEHPLASRRQCAFVDTLAWEHVGLAPTSAVNLMQARAAAQAGLRIRYRAMVSNFESALKVVRANLGISIIPGEIASPYEDTFCVRVIPLADDWARRRFLIVWRAHPPLPKAAALLVDFLTSVPPCSSSPGNETASTLSSKRLHTRTSAGRQWT